MRYSVSMCRAHIAIKLDETVNPMNTLELTFDDTSSISSLTFC